MKDLKKIFVIISLLTFVMMLNACAGSNGEPPGATLSPFDTSNFPLTVTSAQPIFSFAFDNDGNLLFPAESAAELRSINRSTGEVTIIATGLSGDHWRGITANENWIFIGAADGRILQVDPSTGATSLLTTISGGSYINCLAIAPSTFGSYGGQIIAASDTGIYAVNISSLSVVQITGAIEVSSIVISSDGTLYAALEDSNKIVTVTAAGAVSDFVTTGLANPDGITIDETNGYLYVTNDGDGSIRRVEIASGTVTTTAIGLSFSAGWAPSPIIYDAVSNILLVAYFGSPMTINSFGL